MTKSVGSASKSIKVKQTKRQSNYSGKFKVGGSILIEVLSITRLLVNSLIQPH